MKISIPEKEGSHPILIYALQSSHDSSPVPDESTWITHSGEMFSEQEAKQGLERAIGISLNQYHVRVIKISGTVKLDFTPLN